MITPKLEQLIWEGKAFFKTYVAGPTKSTLNIDNDRFIIITDVQFSGFADDNPVFGIQEYPNIQLNIYGEKGFNHYLFRNNKQEQQVYYDSNNFTEQYAIVKTGNEPQTINTYLLHTTQVGFSFLLANRIVNTVANASVSNPSLTPPLDYGKDGDAGVISVVVSGVTGGTMTNFYTNRQGFALPDGVVTTQQIQFPVQAGTLPIATTNFCFANVNYIEILGKPENMQF